MLRLAAVCEIMSRSGLLPVSALDASGENGYTAQAFAERMLNETSRAIQNSPWWPTERVEETVSPTLYTFDNAQWTDATKRITQAGKFSAAVVGQTITMTGGTGVTAGNVKVTAVDGSGNYIDVDTDINSGGGDIANGVTGTAYNNVITVPDGTITIKTYGISAHLETSQFGSRLYDRDNNTLFWTQTLTIERTILIKFECLPEPIAKAIVGKAAVEFNTRWPAANKQLLRIVQVNADDTFAEANKYHNRQAGVNVFESPDSLRFRGGRRMSEDVIAY